MGEKITKMKEKSALFTNYDKNDTFLDLGPKDEFNYLPTPTPAFNAYESLSEINLILAIILIVLMISILLYYVLAFGLRNTTGYMYNRYAYVPKKRNLPNQT